MIVIITDKFVFLHYPKTGGVFVRENLQTIHTNSRILSLITHKPYYQELKTPNLKRTCGRDVLQVHGTWEQIPKKYRIKPIIGCIRNPFDLYVSIYEFRRWTRRFTGDEMIKREYPTFPELSFEQFLHYANKFEIKYRTYRDLLRIDIGFITYTLIQFFFKEPKKIIANLNEEYLASDHYREDMADIIFLHTENLNVDLCRCLLDLGYDESDVSFIRNKGRIHTTSGRVTKDWKKYYTQESYDYIRHKERFFLRIFPEYDEGPKLLVE